MMDAALPIASTLADVFAAVATPSKSVLVERADYNFQEKNKTYKILLSDEQYGTVQTALSKSGKGLYSLPAYNCSNFVKSVLRRANVHLKKKVFNTPNSLSRQLSQRPT